MCNPIPLIRKKERVLKKYGVGLVGYGFIGKVHTYSYKNIPFYYRDPPCEVKLVGVCTSRSETAKEAMEQGGFSFATADYRELLDRDDIQIINCCLPNYLHKDVVINALKAGKHVCCEKPLALNLKEAKEIYEVAKNSRVKHQITFQNRFIPAIMRAKQLIEEGNIGEIFSFRGVHLHSSCVTQKSQAYSWKVESEKVGGGVLVDLGSHLIDLTRYLIGEFKSVNGYVKNFTSPDKRTDDLALLSVEMMNGAVGSLEASKMATGTNDDLRIEVHGSKGAIQFDSMEPNWLKYYDNTEPEKPIGGKKGFTKIETIQKYPEPSGIPISKFPIGWMRYHVACLHSFLRSIIDGTEASPNFKDGLEVQKIIEATYISSNKKERIEISELDA
jgi:predicted dehydrogenase